MQINWHCHKWYPHKNQFIADLGVKKFLKLDHFCRNCVPLKNTVVIGTPCSLERLGLSAQPHQGKTLIRFFKLHTISIRPEQRCKLPLIYLHFLYLQNKINAQLHKRKYHVKTQSKNITTTKADVFYSQIPQDLIDKLFIYCKRDYDMLGYPTPKWIQRTQ